MKRNIVERIYVLIILTLVSQMSMNVFAKEHKKRPKENNGNTKKNICDITDRKAKVHCYCGKAKELRNAAKAECWVFNGEIPRDDLIWHSFASQPTLETVIFNVRVDGNLEYVPSQALSYLQQLKSINIKYGNISNVTPYSFSNLTELYEADLSQNQIKTLQQYSFVNLLNIFSVNLEDNLIVDINFEAFYDLPNLKTLILTKNNISIIKNGTFQYLYKLLELHLNKNNIYHLNRRTFDGLANLKKLDLRQNRIENLTEFTFAELWSLQELMLSKNQLKYISHRAFDGLSQLQILSIDENKLETLPPRLFEGVRGLQSLDLRSNKLLELSFNNIKPIIVNLELQNSNLLLEGNNFKCDCKLNWIHVFYNETKSQNTKVSLEKVTCVMDVPDSINKNNVGTLEVNGSEGEEINQLHYNQDILHANLTVETLFESINSTTNEKYTKDLLRNHGINTRSRILKLVLQNEFLCERDEQTTVIPLFNTDPIMQNEIISYRLQEVTSDDTKLRSAFLLIVTSTCLCLTLIVEVFFD